MQNTILSRLDVTPPTGWDDRSRSSSRLRWGRRSGPTSSSSAKVSAIATSRPSSPTTSTPCAEPRGRAPQELDEEAAFGAHHGYLIDYSFSAPTGQPGAVPTRYRQRQFFLLSGTTIYTFTYSDLAATFAEGAVALETFVGNVSIRDDVRRSDIFELVE